MAPQYRLDAMVPQDVAHLLGLSQAVGWDFNRDEWWTMFLSGRVIGHRNENGDVVSCAGIVPYGPEFAVIGGVIVHPDHQGQGLGIKLMERATGMLPEQDGGGTYGLVATKRAVNLYLNQGFEITSRIWNGYADGPLVEPESLEGTGYSLRTSLPMKDLNNYIHVDGKHFGYSRANFIKRRFAQAPERAFLYGEDGKMAGYALGVCRDETMMIGPVGAPDARTAIALIQSIGSRHQGRLRIDLPARHEELVSICGDLGFEHANDCAVMLKGGAALEKNWDNYYAVAAQAYL